MVTLQLEPPALDELVLNTGQLVEGEPAACYAATSGKQHPIRLVRKCLADHTPLTTLCQAPLHLSCPCHLASGSKGTWGTFILGVER